MNLFRFGASLLAVSMLSACSSTPDTLENLSNKLVVELSPVSFWDGKIFPPSGFCQLMGGLGQTPTFVVKHAPKGTNAILIEIDNLSIDGLDSKGGLGTYGYVYKAELGEEVTLLPIPGGVSDLEAPAFLEKSHRVPERKPAAYMPPCPKYNFSQNISATIKAVKRVGTFENQKTYVLDSIVIPLGVLD